MSDSCDLIEDWMSFYIRPRTADIFPMSITEWCGKGFKLSEFLVILDEFPTSTEEAKVAVLVRSVLRSCKIPCIMMGTNSRVVNLIGSEGARHSGGNVTHDVWCTVFCRLNVSKSFEELTTVENTFLQFASQRDAEFEEFAKKFLILFRKQISSSRPGLSDLLLKSLSVISSCSGELTPVEFMNKFCDKLFSYLHSRKPTLNDSEGFYGNVIMMQAAGVECKLPATAHVEKHFFYLSPPTLIESCCFNVYLKGGNLTLEPERFKTTNLDIIACFIPPPNDECFLYPGCWGGGFSESLKGKLQNSSIYALLKKFDEI